MKQSLRCDSSGSEFSTDDEPTDVTGWARQYLGETWRAALADDDALSDRKADTDQTDSSSDSNPPAKPEADQAAFHTQLHGFVSAEAKEKLHHLMVEALFQIGWDDQDGLVKRALDQILTTAGQEIELPIWIQAQRGWIQWEPPAQLPSDEPGFSLMGILSTHGVAFDLDARQIQLMDHQQGRVYPSDLPDTIASDDSKTDRAANAFFPFRDAFEVHHDVSRQADQTTIDIEWRLNLGESAADKSDTESDTQWIGTESGKEPTDEEQAKAEIEKLDFVEPSTAETNQTIRLRLEFRRHPELIEAGDALWQLWGVDSLLGSLVRNLRGELDQDEFPTRVQWLDDDGQTPLVEWKLAPVLSLPLPEQLRQWTPENDAGHSETNETEPTKNDAPQGQIPEAVVDLMADRIGTWLKEDGLGAGKGISVSEEQLAVVRSFFEEQFQFEERTSVDEDKPQTDWSSEFGVLSSALQAAPCQVGQESSQAPLAFALPQQVLDCVRRLLNGFLARLPDIRFLSERLYRKPGVNLWGPGPPLLTEAEYQRLSDEEKRDFVLPDKPPSSPGVDSFFLVHPKQWAGGLYLPWFRFLEWSSYRFFLTPEELHKQRGKFRYQSGEDFEKAFDFKQAFGGTKEEVVKLLRSAGFEDDRIARFLDAMVFASWDHSDHFFNYLFRMGPFGDFDPNREDDPISPLRRVGTNDFAAVSKTMGAFLTNTRPFERWGIIQLVWLMQFMDSIDRGANPLHAAGIENVRDSFQGGKLKASSKFNAENRANQLLFENETYLAPPFNDHIDKRYHDYPYRFFGHERAWRILQRRLNAMLQEAKAAKARFSDLKIYEFLTDTKSAVFGLTKKQKDSFDALQEKQESNSLTDAEKKELKKLTDLIDVTKKKQADWQLDLLYAYQLYVRYIAGTVFVPLSPKMTIGDQWKLDLVLGECVIPLGRNDWNSPDSPRNEEVVRDLRFSPSTIEEKDGQRIRRPARLSLTMKLGQSQIRIRELMVREKDYEKGVHKKPLVYIPEEEGNSATLELGEFTLHLEFEPGNDGKIHIRPNLDIDIKRVLKTLSFKRSLKDFLTSEFAAQYPGYAFLRVLADILTLGFFELGVPGIIDGLIQGNASGSIGGRLRGLLGGLTGSGGVLGSGTLASAERALRDFFPALYFLFRWLPKFGDEFRLEEFKQEAHTLPMPEDPPEVLRSKAEQATTLAVNACGLRNGSAVPSSQRSSSSNLQQTLQAGVQGALAYQRQHTVRPKTANHLFYMGSTACNTNLLSHFAARQSDGKRYSHQFDQRDNAELTEQFLSVLHEFRQEGNAVSLPEPDLKALEEIEKRLAEHRKHPKTKAPPLSFELVSGAFPRIDVANSLDRPVAESLQASKLNVDRPRRLTMIFDDWRLRVDLKAGPGQEASQRYHLFSFKVAIPTEVVLGEFSGSRTSVTLSAGPLTSVGGNPLMWSSLDEQLFSFYFRTDVLKRKENGSPEKDEHGVVQFAETHTDLTIDPNHLATNVGFGQQGARWFHSDEGPSFELRHQLLTALKPLLRLAVLRLSERKSLNDRTLLPTSYPTKPDANGVKRPVYSGNLGFWPAKPGASASTDEWQQIPSWKNWDPLWFLTNQRKPLLQYYDILQIGHLPFYQVHFEMLDDQCLWHLFLRIDESGIISSSAHQLMYLPRRMFFDAGHHRFERLSHSNAPPQDQSQTLNQLREVFRSMRKFEQKLVQIEKALPKTLGG